VVTAGSGAVTYARISKDEADEGVGVAWQAELCRREAATRDLTIVGEFADNNKGAFTRGLRREGYERMLARIVLGGVDVVLCVNVDRLFRQDRERLRFYDTCVEVGTLLIVSVDGIDVDLSTADGRRAFRDLGSAAEHASDRQSERLRRMHERKAERGEWSGGGRRPFGYIVVAADGTRADTQTPEDRRTLPKPFKLKVERGEARLLKSAAKEILTGASLHHVTTDWNDRGIRTASGGRWNISDVRRVLLSPQVAGVRVHRRSGLVTEGDWPAVLDRDTHELLTRLLTDPSRRPVERDANALMRRYVLAGLLVCGRCGTKLGGRFQTRRLRGGEPVVRRMYTCSSAQGGCSKLGITAPAVERYLLRLGLDHHGFVADRPEPEPELPDVEPELLAELRQLDERRAKLSEDYALGLLDGRQVHEVTRTLDERSVVLRRRLGATIPIRRRSSPVVGSTDFYRFIGGEIPELPLEESVAMNEWLRTQIVSVTVAPARAQGVRFDESRLTVAWRNP
jgi:DNA invertase Pin-like site-specific DNA recombinase